MDEMVKYKAADGMDVTLTAEEVVKYVATGDGKPTDRDVAVFLATCQARGLNPLAGDAYMVTMGGRTTVMTSKDYFVRVARSKPSNRGWKAGVIVVDRQGELRRHEGACYGSSTERLVGGWAEVYDHVTDEYVDSLGEVHVSSELVTFSDEVALAEYDKRSGLWKTMPGTMIRKVALVHALREAYPGSFSGVYDQSEMPAVEVPSKIAGGVE